MELFKKPNIDFMGTKWIWIGISLTLIVLSIVQVAVYGVNKGVEFTGGAEVILRFVEVPQLDQVRSRLEAAGIPSVSVTTFGESGGAEVVVRAGLGGKQQSGEGDLAAQITEALMPADARQKVAQGLVNLNTVDSVTVSGQLVRQAGMAEDQAAQAAEQLSEFRRTNGGVVTVAQAQAIPGLPEPAKAWLGAHTFAGPFGLRSQEVIEAAVSREMRTKALMAAVGALGGMLVYLWVRFRFQWGLGAVLALFHDTIVTLGFFSLAGFEANLPVVAAFLTLIGFSVNDTIVIFDRIREIQRAHPTAKLEALVNDAVNGTLSRTVITTLTVLFIVVSLFAFGGPVLKPFSFVLVVGVIVGSYSTIYVASPVIVLWQKLMARLFGEKAAGKAVRA